MESNEAFELVIDAVESDEEDDDELIDARDLLYAIGDEFRWKRSDLHEKAIRKVLNVLIEFPKMIGEVVENGDRTEGPASEAGTITMLFNTSDHYTQPTKPNKIPKNSIRFTKKDGKIYKVETWFDESWGRYNLSDIEGAMVEQCELLIRLVKAAEPTRRPSPLALKV